MSGTYSGRRGPAVNVSQLLQDLNRIPEPAPQPDEAHRNLDDELAMFTNTNFIDWDTGDERADRAATTDAGGGGGGRVDTHSSATSPTDRVSSEAVGDLTGFDFGISGDFNGFEFHPYSTPNVSAYPENIGNLQPIQPSPTFPPNGTHQNTFGPQIHQSGDKRKSEAAPPQRRQLSFEEHSRLAAEEDKRRRNTAASARFRVKKKAREQALEKREKELGDKVSSLETRIQSLETENKWLRDLVMEKTGGGESLVSALLDKRPEQGSEEAKKLEESSKPKPETSS